MHYQVDWNELSAEQQELIMQAARNYAACDNANITEHRKNVLYHAIVGVAQKVLEEKDIKVDTCKDIIMWTVLRDRSIAEALEADLNTGKASKKGKAVNTSDYPDYVQDGIQYFRLNLGKYYEDYVNTALSRERRVYAIDWYANARVHEIFKQFTEQGYVELVNQLKHESAVWRRTHLLNMHEPTSTVEVDWMRNALDKLRDLKSDIRAAARSLQYRVEGALDIVGLESVRVTLQNSLYRS